MRKFLLTLATAFVAAFAIAQDYTQVVSSIEELKALPDETIVLFENIDVVVVEQDMGYYVQKINCLSDGTTQINGETPFPMPLTFTAVGYLHTAEDYDGTTYREFYVMETKSVSKFATLGELVNFASSASNTTYVENSPLITAKNGNAVITHVYGDYVFYYTIVNTGYYNQTVYSVFKVAGASGNPECWLGAELMPNNGWFGKVTPSVAEYDEDWNLVSYKGGNFELSANCIFWSINWTPEPIAYSSCSLSDVDDGYMREAMAVRFPAGGTFVERDGKYFYEATYTTEVYNYDTYEWEFVEKTASIETASNYVDLSQYVGQPIEDFLGGVWDMANTGDSQRLLLTEFISPVARYENISDFLSVGEQQEEEIVTEFNNPLTVTYKFDDGNYKFVLIVEDESGAVAIDYSEAVTFDEEGAPSADYAALKAIEVGDAITGVKGYPQYYNSSRSPVVNGAVYNYSDEALVAYIPTVASKGAEVKPAMTVTVGDMLNEWKDCQENGSTPKIANNVVRLLGVQVLDTLDQWGYDVKYLIQGTDTMELSNLWDEDKMNFQCYDVNNMVGIADYCCINTNYIYQFMPLSQEYITDGSIVPEVSTLDELKANEGLPVVVKNVTTKMVSSGYYADYYIFDEVMLAGFTVEGTFDLYGIYEEGAFAVYEVRNVYGFNTIGDLHAYTELFPEAAGQVYSIDGPVVVTQVDGDNVFVQYQGSQYGRPVMRGEYIKGLNIDANRGDKIQGLRGVATPCDWYMDASYNTFVNKGSNFEMADDAVVSLLGTGNEIEYGASAEFANMIYSLPDLTASAIKIKPVGDILEDGGRYYYRETAYSWDYEKQEQIEVHYTLELVSNDVDLSEYVGAELQDNIIGVLDYKNSSDDVKLYVHGFASNNIECQNIAEVLAVGPFSDYSMTASIANPVVVTYVYKADWAAGLAVQDETGAIFVSFNDPATVEGIQVGDMVTGIKGGASWGGGTAPALYGYDNGTYLDYPVTVVSQGHSVEPKVVTLAEINADAAKYANYEETTNDYANYLVKVQEVTYTMGVDAYGEEWPCLTQGDDVLFVVKNFAELFAVEEGQTFDMVGVVDYRRMNLSNLFTIQPRSAADFAAAAVEGVEVANGGIYLDAAYQVVAPGAVAVVIYDVNGRQVGTTDAAGLAEGVYVVRATYADGAVVAAKVVR